MLLFYSYKQYHDINQNMHGSFQKCFFFTELPAYLCIFSLFSGIHLVYVFELVQKSFH